MLENFTLIRQEYDKEGTPGKLINSDGVNLGAALEKPWLNNKPGQSCIPEGDYICEHDETGTFRYWKVEDVPYRSNIEIHPANCIDDLEGCIALGAKIKSYQKHPKTGKVYKYWLDQSKLTIDRLKNESILPSKFRLKITSKEKLCQK